VDEDTEEEADVEAMEEGEGEIVLPAATLLPLISSEGDREEVGAFGTSKEGGDITTEEVDNAMEEREEDGNAEEDHIEE